MDGLDEAVIVNSSRLKSVVWNDFDRVKDVKHYMAVCRHCKRILSGSSTSGTSHLRNHLTRCRKRSNHDITQFLTRGKRKQSTIALTKYNSVQIKNDMVTFASNTSAKGLKVEYGMGSFNIDQMTSQTDLARMIIMHGYPLSMVEDIGFKTFLRNLQPSFDLVTVDSVLTDCMEIYGREKQTVYEELDKLPGKVSLGAERWTPTGDIEYLSLIAHFIDDSWELKKRVLNFVAIDPFQAENLLSEVIMRNLRNWDIDRNMFSLRVDDCSTYDKIVNRIRDQLSQHKFLMCEGQLFDVRCAANTIKLLVQDVPGTSRELSDKVREAIRLVQNSQTTREKFEEIVHLVGSNCQQLLCLKNPFQWNSTCSMLETALEYKEALSQLQEHDHGFSIFPSCVDWDRLRAIIIILKFFHEVSNVFAGGKHFTANSYFTEICDIHLQLIE